MKLAYAPLCSRGGRKSGFIRKVLFSLFSTILVDGSQQVSGKLYLDSPLSESDGGGFAVQLFQD